MLCPKCKKELKTIEPGPVPSPYDKTCGSCNSKWKNDYLKAFWDGYDQCAGETSIERKNMIDELTRLSLEWQSANRMLWCAAKANDGEFRINQEVMAAGNEPGNFIDVQHDQEKNEIVIYSKNEPGIKAPELRIIH